LATEDYVDQAVNDVSVDLTGYATEDYVDTAISNIDIPEVDLTGYATEDYVDTAITNLATEDYVDTAISNIPEVDLTGYATETFVGTAISNLVDTAPSTLNTLNELAAALGDDANFATTVTTALGNKAPINDPTFTGTVSGITATMVGLGSVTNESKATMFTSPTFTGTTTLQQNSEILNTKTSATGTVTHDFSTGSIWYHSSISANFTANFTNIPTTDNRTTVVTLILSQGGTAYIPNAVQINSSSVTINWLGSEEPEGTAGGKDIVSFTLIRVSGNWVLLGSLSPYGAV
jgi:hypothetical protein